LAIDALRREGRHHAVRLDEDHASGDVEDGRFMSMLESTTISPLDRMETEERAEWTREAIDNLPDHLRMVVLLIYFHGRKYQEAAEVLHVPLGTIKSRLHKALVVLNQAWRRNQG
jgi:RNA polymerase sigma-70 factor (ECF subfamily)